MRVRSFSSPLAVAHLARALAERPVRHRRHPEIRRGEQYQTPLAAWWDGVALDDRWFPADFPPRPGNRLTPLIDGEHAMRAMYEAMEGARASIHLAAWFLTPEMRLLRPPDDCDDPPDGRGGPHALLSLLTRKAGEVDVRVLLWPGALLGKFSHRHAKATHRALVRAHPNLHARLDTRERLSHCQHQKALVVDGRVAFVGGIDVTAFDADRWDVQEHSFRPGRNWHDAHWQLEGPSVADVAANFAQRWNALAPHDPVPLAPSPPESDAAQAGDATVQVLRTIPARVYPFAPHGIYGIGYAYLHAIARAERFIYLESQYLWSPEITDALCDAIQRGVHVALVLPSHPNVGKADSDRHVDDLIRADDGRGFFRPYTLYTSRRSPTDQGYEYRPVYVHAKVAIIDDAWATLGSANLNGRGMATDSELNLATTDAAAIRALRLRLWSEHLACDEAELRDQDPLAVLTGRWIDTAEAQRRIVDERSGLLSAAIYPYPTGWVDADFGPGEIESALLDR